MQVLNSHPEYKVQRSNFIIEIETNAITVIHEIEIFLEIAFKQFSSNFFAIES